MGGVEVQPWITRPGTWCTHSDQLESDILRWPKIRRNVFDPGKDLAPRRVQRDILLPLLRIRIVYAGNEATRSLATLRTR